MNSSPSVNTRICLHYVRECFCAFDGGSASILRPYQTRRPKFILPLAVSIITFFRLIVNQVENRNEYKVVDQMSMENSAEWKRLISFVALNGLNKFITYEKLLRFNVSCSWQQELKRPVDRQIDWRSNRENVAYLKAAQLDDMYICQCGLTNKIWFVVPTKKN